MAQIIQIFNPVHGQRVSHKHLNVMGKALDAQVKSISIIMNNHLLRRVTVNRSGTFECRIALDHLPMGKHEIELRAIHGVRTERIIVPFNRVEAPAGTSDVEESEAIGVETVEPDA